MKECVIVQDVTGHPLRIQALRDSHPHVFAVSPPDCHQPHTRPFSVPAEWLSADRTIPYKRKCWLRSAFVGLAAVQDHQIDADFYWFIESDCVASQDRWKAIFADHRDSPIDCLSHPVREKHQLPGNPSWTHPGTPPWADCLFIMACYRLSRRAVQEATRCAEETRECFSELALPSIIRRAGMTMASVNARQTHWNQQTFRTVPERVILNPSLLNHPVKGDSYGPANARCSGPIGR